MGSPDCGFSGLPCEFSHPIMNQIYFTSATQDTGEEEEDGDDENEESNEGDGDCDGDGDGDDGDVEKKLELEPTTKRRT